MSHLVVKAKAVAVVAHAGTFRRNSAKKPYITHPKEVAALVRASGGNEIEIAAAWLHDVTEDNPAFPISYIEDEFGKAVSLMISGLTDTPDLKGITTRERKQIQAARVLMESDSIKRVKLADQISNMRDMASHPPEKWDKQKRHDYIEGSRLVAEACSGISLFLDSEFQVAHLRAMAEYLYG